MFLIVVFVLRRVHFVAFRFVSSCILSQQTYISCDFFFEEFPQVRVLALVLLVLLRLLLLPFFLESCAPLHVFSSGADLFVG